MAVQSTAFFVIDPFTGC